MNSLLIAITIISGLFVIFLILKGILRAITRKEFCVICAAVSMTWVGLLTASSLQMFEDKTLIALLMGQSIVGLFYLVEAKVNEDLKLFRLPFLLTATVVAYALLGIPEGVSFVIFFLAVLWLLFLLLYLYKNNKYAHSIVKRVLECCKNW